MPIARLGVRKQLPQMKFCNVRRLGYKLGRIGTCGEGTDETREQSMVRDVCFGMVLAVSLLIAGQTKAEDGYRLWLRYDLLPSRMVAVYRPLV